MVSSVRAVRVTLNVASNVSVTRVKMLQEDGAVLAEHREQLLVAHDEDRPSRRARALARGDVGLGEARVAELVREVESVVRARRDDGGSCR